MRKVKISKIYPVDIYVDKQKPSLFKRYAQRGFKEILMGKVEEVNARRKERQR